MKILKMLGLSVALTGCGLALAGFYCDRCHIEHSGDRCPAVTLGFACDDHYGYGYHEGYACFDDGYNSDDEDELIRMAIERRRQHHEWNIYRICESFHHIRNANDFRRVQEALNDRARDLGIHMNQNHYGCEPYGCDMFGFECADNRYDCCDRYNYGCEPYGCDMFGFECADNRYDCNDWGYGCFEPYGCY